LVRYTPIGYVYDNPRLWNLKADVPKAAVPVYVYFDNRDAALGAFYSSESDILWDSGRWAKASERDLYHTEGEKTIKKPQDRGDGEYAADVSVRAVILSEDNPLAKKDEPHWYALPMSGLGEP
jgi:hypothetical protein